MKPNTTALLFALLGSAMSGEPLTAGEAQTATAEEVTAVLAVARRHDIAQLVARGLKLNACLPSGAVAPEQEIWRAVCRCEGQQYELEQVCRVLEQAHIPHLPLKGSVLRAYYPEPWMRTSCDIDVLVHPTDRERARTALTEQLGYTYRYTGSHDLSLFSPAGVHVELHYELVEDGVANASAAVLRTVWERSSVRDGTACHYEMPDELFYFYHLAHMAKHFENGGCGIRSFLDLWVLNRRRTSDGEACRALLAQGGLTAFAAQAERLAEVWFGGAEHTALTRQMEEYILRGGAHGSEENRIALQQQKHGGRWHYAVAKLWIPYDEIKFHYPVLQRHRWLMPLMQVRRWGKLLFGSSAKKTQYQWQCSSRVSDTRAAELRALLEQLEL